MKKILVGLFVYGISLGAFAQEYNASRQDDDLTSDNGGAFARTIYAPALAGGFTNNGHAFIAGSYTARRGDNIRSTNVLVITRSRTTVVGSVTSTWTDILVHQGWTNANTVTVEAGYDWIANGDTLTVTNTTTNINITINAGKP